MINKLKYATSKYAHRIAYKHNDEEITFSELWQKVNEYGSLLKRQGSGPIIIYGHKSKNMLFSMLACIFSHRTYIPIDTYMPLERLKYITDLTSAELIIANEIITVDYVDCCTLKDLYKYKDYPEIICKNEVIYTIFTSGSTGTPKGVPISNENLVNFTDWISTIEPLNEYEAIKVANQASFSFDLSVADIYYSICNGHTLIGMDSETQNDFGKLFDYYLDNKIEMTVTTPTFMKLCLLIKEFNHDNLPYLKCFYFCGEQLEVSTVKKLKERFPECKIINAYGPTEATSAVSASLITDEDLHSEDLLPVGNQNSFATQIDIEDNEIILSGKSVFSGYIGDVTGGYFNNNGINCYRTGDIGFIKNGKLYCQGRKDSQIKFKGYRIELFDIENNLKLINGITDAAVIAKYSSSGSVKHICAFVVCNDDVTIEMIKSSLKLKVPPYMIPSRITILDHLPMNENKKIDRRSLDLL